MNVSDLIPLHLMWMRAGGRSERTIHDRERLLLHADRVLPYGIDQAHTNEWAAYLANPRWQPWTRCIYDRHARGYYRWAVPCYLTFNPMDALIRPPEGDREPDPATDEELAQALDQLPPMPWRLAVIMAAYAGLRCCEIVSIRREQCTAESLRVRGKGGKVTVMPMAPQLWAEIKDRPPGLLVTGARGKPLSPQMLTQMQRKIWIRIGQPHQHMHRFRAWFCTTLINAGVNVRVVQELMRHSDLKPILHYAAVAKTQRLAAIAVLPTFTGAPASQ